MVYGYVDLAEELFNAVKQNSLISKEAIKIVTSILVKITKRNLLPNFRGKNRIRNMILGGANIFSDNGPYSGCDESIGNSL